MFQSGTICSQQPSFELNFVSLIRPSVHQWNNSTMFVRKRPKISHKSSYKTVTSLSNVNSQVCNYSVLISHFPSQLNTRIPLWPVVLVADILTLLRCWFGTYHTAKSCPQLAVEFWTLIKQYIERTRKKINWLSSLKYFDSSKCHSISLILSCLYSSHRTPYTLLWVTGRNSYYIRLYPEGITQLLQRSCELSPWQRTFVAKGWNLSWSVLQVRS